LESAREIQYAAAEKTATEIKAAADKANTALSFVAGGQAALGVFKAAQTMQTTSKMFQAGMSSAFYKTMKGRLSRKSKSLKALSVKS
jgi:hypothetical protein